MTFTAAVAQAGIIEGFFGPDWGWPARRSGVEFLSSCGYQFYIYAPKSDAFLRRRWREPLPAATEQSLADLQQYCMQEHLSLGIGLTPFEIYLDYDAAARRALRGKVTQINEIQADILCILFDDMRGDVDGLPTLQAGIIDDICTWSNARHFIMCPTYYSYDVRLVREFGPPPKSYLRDLGVALDPRIDVFWTGEKVISAAYPAAHLREVAADLGRKPFIWDNQISNDSRARSRHLYLSPDSGAWQLPPDLAAGIAINPMNQPHLTRIALRDFGSLLASPGHCKDLYGEDFAAQLRDDAPCLQAGLDGIEPAARRRLLERYEAQISNPFAREISAWLRDEYRFDPACLTG